MLLELNGTSLRQEADAPSLLNLEAFRKDLIRQLISMTTGDFGVHENRKRRYDLGILQKLENRVDWDISNSDTLTYYLPSHLNPEEPASHRIYRRIEKGESFLNVSIWLLMKILTTVEAIENKIWPSNIYFRMHLIGYFPGHNKLAHATPDRIHQDGVRWTSIVLVDRTNVSGGDNLFFEPIHTGKKLSDINTLPKATIKLEDSFDMVLWNDEKLSHYVTPMTKSLNDGESRRVILIIDVWH